MRIELGVNRNNVEWWWRWVPTEDLLKLKRVYVKGVEWGWFNMVLWFAFFLWWAQSWAHAI